MRSTWTFTPESKSHTQDGSELVQLMKSIGQGRKKVLALDIGCGDGIITHDILKFGKASSVIAIDISEKAALVAKKNLEQEILQNRVQIICAPAQSLFSNKKYFDQFDRFVINPPFFPKGSGLKNKRQSDQLARHEEALSLREWAGGARNLLKTGGELYFVFPTERLSEACSCLSDNQIEPKEVWWLRADSRRRRFFMRATRGAQVGVKIHF